MNAEFNVWLLIVGLVVGAGLAWLVMLDGRRRDSEIDAEELPREAAWLSAVLAEDGYGVDPATAEQLLLLHRAYLGAPPPDPIDDHADDHSAEVEVDEFTESAPGVAPDDQASDRAQRSPARTSTVSAEPSTVTSDTPNRASSESPSTAGTGPTQ